MCEYQRNQNDGTCNVVQDKKQDGMLKELGNKIPRKEIQTVKNVKEMRQNKILSLPINYRKKLVNKKE